MNALDLLEACLPPARTESSAADAAVLQRASLLRTRFEAADAALYQEAQRAIRQGECPAEFVRLMQTPWSATPEDPKTQQQYDAVDEVVAGVFNLEEPPPETALREPEMVFYQPTPARHVFTWLGSGAVTEDDVVIDLGSGLGHVPLLVSICTRARSLGVELQPGYVACASAVARQLKLDRVEFIAGDVRQVDLSRGTVFYLYTPFTGSVLRGVLDLLRQHARQRSIRVCTFGPCTRDIAREPWLQAAGGQAGPIATFHSHP